MHEELLQSKLMAFPSLLRCQAQRGTIDQFGNSLGNSKNAESRKNNVVYGDRFSSVKFQLLITREFNNFIAKRLGGTNSLATYLACNTASYLYSHPNSHVLKLHTHAQKIGIATYQYT